jgi:hypothetical protein
VAPPVSTRWRPGQSGNPHGKRPGARTARTLARTKRASTVETLEAIARRGREPDAGADILRCALEACRMLLAYSDGEPGAGNVPTEMDERRAESEEDVDLSPPSEAA